MPHIVTSNCDDCRFTDCVEVCPVDCFYTSSVRPNMIFIDPDDCIDCQACVPECPVSAIYAEEDLPEDQQEYIDINAQGAKADDAENVTEKVDPLPTAEDKRKALGF